MHLISWKKCNEVWFIRWKKCMQAADLDYRSYCCKFET